MPSVRRTETQNTVGRGGHDSGRPAFTFQSGEYVPMDKPFTTERGSALLIALLLTGMLTLVAFIAMDNSNTDIALSYNVMNSDRAFYAAEAGVKRSLVALNADPSWNEGFADVPIGAGSFSVAVEDSSVTPALADTIIVTSTGLVRDAQSTIEMTLVPVRFNPFLKALFGDNSVDIKNSMESDSYNSDSGAYAGTRTWHDGDVGSNGTITIANGAIVGGGVATSQPGGLSINAGATVYDDTTSTAPRQEVPDVPQTEFDWAAAHNQNLSGISGSFTYNPSTKAFETSGSVTLSSGVYYFSSIILKNSASMEVAPGATVMIYVTGDIEMKNSAAMNTAGAPKDLQIYSQGDIVLKNSGDIHAVFYSAGGEADLRNSGQFFGAVVARDIVVHNSAKFHYDRSLGEIEKNWDAHMKVVAWREL